MQIMFLAESSGEPEHFPLARPIQRDRIGSGQFAASEIYRLSAVHDGCDDIRR
jgi:hypothetical protein